MAGIDYTNHTAEFNLTIERGGFDTLKGDFVFSAEQTPEGVKTALINGGLTPMGFS